METLKITIINFTRHNPWGHSDYATHYYVNGKRIRANEYHGWSPFLEGWKYDHREERSDKNKQGINRDYMIIYYKRPKRPVK